MSRSNNTEIKNPAEKFFQWSGSDGQIKYYDKEAQENQIVDFPFPFLVLDRLTTMTGYSDEDQSGIWSNEIRNTKTQELTVRTKSGIKKKGLYEEVKTVTGAKYAQSVYLAFYDENKNLQIGNFKMSGSAVSAWIEFCKGRDIYKGAVKITGAEEQKKGATKYYSPIFEAIPEVKETTEENAKALDVQLQEYLTAYFALRGEEMAHAATASGNNSYIEQRNAELNDYDKSTETAFEENLPPVSDDEIPF